MDMFCDGYTYLSSVWGVIQQVCVHGASGNSYAFYQLLTYYLSGENLFFNRNIPSTIHLHNIICTCENNTYFE